MNIPRGMTLFIGAPGSGKTTLCAHFFKKFTRSKKYKGKTFFSNVPIVGATVVDPQNDFGKFLVEDGVVCVDEGGIEFNNRKFKTLSSDVIQFAKLYRHYGISSFVFFSQGLDIDITFIRLCDRVCIVRKSLLPFFIFIREYHKYVGVDDTTGQLVDKYEPSKRLFPFIPKVWWVFAPSCWKLFDTYEAPNLPTKQFPLWDNKSRFITK